MSKGWATDLNFTLELDGTSEWAKEQDLNLEENLMTRYLSNVEMDTAMGQLENSYPEVVEFMANDNAWNMKVHVLKITSPEKEQVRKLKLCSRSPAGCQSSLILKDIPLYYLVTR